MTRDGIGSLRAQRRSGPASVRRTIRALLADGCWHTWAEISQRVGALLNPENARREYLRNNPNQAKPLWVQIESGRQYCLCRALRAMGLEWRGARWVQTRSYRLPQAGDA